MAELPWVEKYRPRTISGVRHQEEVVSMLQRAVADGATHGNLPHLLLYGPPGTGKTSLALALCRELFGTGDPFRSRVLELNASDERGIRVVRDKIKTFAQRTVSRVDESGRKALPPFKVIVLDEADAITADAQTALRRTMEAYSRTTRFILICNYISRIIAPLASRCAKFRFNPLPPATVSDCLLDICREEHVSVESRIVHELIDTCDGDLRKAITTLQSASRIMTKGSHLSSEDVAAAACIVPPHVVDDFDRSSTSKGTTHKALREKIDKVVGNGHSASDLLRQFSRRIMDRQGTGVAQLGQLQRAAIAIAVARAECNLVLGADELLQTYDVASKISTAVRNPHSPALLRSL